MTLVGVLFIGVKDDGEIEGLPSHELDSIQKTLNDELRKAFPPIAYECRILSTQGKNLLAVLIPGSSERPHFAGPSFVRVGSETKIASEQQFAALLAERNSKAYEIRRWIGKDVVVERAGIRGQTPSRFGGRLVDCNAWFYTLEIASGERVSEPVDRVEISFDHKDGRLVLRTPQT